MFVFEGWGNGLDASLCSLTNSSLFEPAMRAISPLLLLGTLTAQVIFGRPDAVRIRRSVDDFITTESPIAMRNLLCNIGPDGCDASGAASGIVVASPSKENPDYTYISNLFPPFFSLFFSLIDITHS